MRNFLIILTLLISINLFSQSYKRSYKNNFTAGLLGGTTFSQVDGDTYGGYHQFGFLVGGFVYTKLSKTIDIQLDITFKQKGSHKTPDIDNKDYVEYYMKLNYIEFPVVARFHFWKMSAEAGLSFGALLSSKEGDADGEFTANPYNVFELGTIIGVNYYFTKQLWFNMRQGYSITPIRVPYKGEVEIYNPVENIFFNRKPGQYNSSVSMSLNYAF